MNPSSNTAVATCDIAPMEKETIHSRDEARVEASANNLAQLHFELEWLEAVIHQVICSYLKHEGHEHHWCDIPMPKFDPGDGVYGDLIHEWSLGRFERLALALGLAPHLRPDILDIFFGLNAKYNRGFTEFGGVTNSSFSGFLPTGQTLAFLICGNDPLWRVCLEDVLREDHRLHAEQVLTLSSVDSGQPALSGVLSLSDQWLHYFITGKKVKPERSAAFPAQSIDTPMEWSTLVLDQPVMRQVLEIKSWLKYGHTLMNEWGLKKKVKPGYRALFFGPPGTGKTLTATLLAKCTNRQIYRVDLSMVVSKYIGETEKNLSRVFNVAGYKDWILFFDEADALFGKRTETHNSNDRHANQQTGYLLQRIEDFPGVVILASNLKANIDEAFTRRFQAMIHFTMPEPPQRLMLWQNAFADSCELAPDIDLTEIAEKYEMAGGGIINVLRYCALSAIARGSKMVMSDELMAGIRREFKKENKTIR